MTMTHIETVTVGSGGAASITFSAIPDTFTDLLLVFSGTHGASYQAALLRFNSDASSLYSYRRLVGTGSNALSQTNQGTTDFPNTAIRFQVTAFADSTSSGKFYIPNYRSSVAKSVSIDNVVERNNTEAYQEILAGLYTGTSAITSLSLTPISGSFAQYSSASLYGITAGSDGIVTVS